MPYCTNCGARAAEDHKYCGGCGNRVAPAESAAPTPAEPALDPTPAPSPASSPSVASGDARGRDESFVSPATRHPEPENEVKGDDSVRIHTTEAPQRPAASRGIGWAVAGSGAVLIIGNWMPWYTIRTGFFRESASGNDISAGAIPVFIMLGLALIGFGTSFIRGSYAGKTQPLIACGCAALAGLLVVIQMADVSTLTDEGFDASVGAGLLFMLLASFAAGGVAVAVAAKAGR